MTSKKYSADTFRHTFSLSFMAALPVAIINFVILFICTAGSLLADMPGGKGSVTVFWNFQFDNESLLILLLDMSLIIGGVATALLIYKYMLGKASTNVFFSVPQTRGQMFAAKYLAGVCLTAASTFLPIFICGLINLINFGSHRGLWMAALYISLRLFATMIFAFTVTAVVCCSVGSVAETIAYSAAFMILPISLKNTVETVICTMLYGSPYTNALLGSINTWSGFGPGGSFNKRIELPLGSFEKYLLPSVFSDISQVSSYVAGEEKYTPVFRYVLIFLAVSAALAGVAALLYKRRKAEKAGFLGANQFMTNLAIFSVSIFAASFISSLAGGMHYESGAALKNYLIFVIVTVPVFLIVELFILRSFKRLLQKLWQLGVQLGIMALVALVFTGGLFGYSSRLPAADEIASVSVTTGTGDIIARPISGRADDYVSYEDRLIDSALLYNLGGYNGELNPLFTGITDSTDIENVIKAHRLLIGCKGQKVTKQSMHAADGERLVPANIRISYKLKNGKEIDRQYFVASDEVLMTLAEITRGDTYKEYVASLLEGKVITSEDGNVTNEYYFEGREIAIASPDFTCVTCAEDYTDTEQRRVLFTAVADDIRNDRLPLDLSSKEKLLGYIVFSMVAYETLDDKAVSEDALFNGGFTAIPVYENMTRTLAVLEETSLTDAFESAKEPVGMTVCRFNSDNCSETFYFDDSSMQMFMGVLAHSQAPNEDVDSGAELKFPADAKTVTDKAVIDEYLGAVRMNYPLTYSGSYVRFEYDDGTLLYGYVPDRLLKK